MTRNFLRDIIVILNNMLYNPVFDTKMSKKSSKAL